jgi:predicted NBD/HSP70 family sugar kinase
MNEQLLLGHIRAAGPCSRADLARISGLSKPTVSLALANVERAGLVRIAGQRTGVPGRTAQLYEVRPEAGFVLGLDIGLKYLRGAVADLTGAVRVRDSRKVGATSVRGRLAELTELADDLCARAGTSRQAVTQTVIGTPGVYDPKHNAIALTGGLAGWDRPAALAGLREAFGPSVALENDVDAAALAERTHGYGRGRESFAFVHVGTGIGMGLVLDGRLRRGVHGVAGEIAFMPLPAEEAESDEARRRGPLEAAAAAAGIVRAARAAGMRGAVSARSVFAAADRGDARAVAVVAAEARLVARAVCCVITVVDPELIVLGGGIGQAPGFAATVTEALRAMTPVLPEVKVSALGTDVVVDGCLAEGASLAWSQLTSGPRSHAAL